MKPKPKTKPKSSKKQITKEQRKAAERYWQMVKKAMS
jgi:hypothetical protein